MYLRPFQQKVEPCNLFWMQSLHWQLPLYKCCRKMLHMSLSCQTGHYVAQHAAGRSWSSSPSPQLHHRLIQTQNHQNGHRVRHFGLPRHLPCPAVPTIKLKFPVVSFAQGPIGYLSTQSQGGCEACDVALCSSNSMRTQARQRRRRCPDDDGNSASTGLLIHADALNLNLQTHWDHLETFHCLATKIPTKCLGGCRDASNRLPI